MTWPCVRVAPKPGRIAPELSAPVATEDPQPGSRGIPYPAVLYSARPSANVQLLILGNRSTMLVRARILTTAFVTVFGLAVGSTALASPIALKVTDGGLTLQIIDNDPFDTNPTVGSISVNTALL